MKKIVSAVTTGLLAVAVCSGVAAQDGPASNPVEMFTCDFREGKGPSDLTAVANKFGKWSKDNSGEYSAWILYPAIKATAEGFDVAWLGAWPSGASMGKHTTAYTDGDHGLAAQFDKVVDCADGHSMVVSYPVNTSNWSTSDGLVSFSSCTLAEGKTGAEATAAHKQMSDIMVAKGSKASNWMFWPALGWGSDIEFDYYSVVAYSGYDELGAAWDRYTTGDTMQKMNAIGDGVTDCDSPRVYSATLVVEGDLPQ